MAGMILIGTVAFGFLSLWELPRIVAKFGGLGLTFNPNDRTESGRTQR
jgi:hypothetical protein